MTTEPRLEHQTVKVKQLIDDYRFGRIGNSNQTGRNPR
jgi:hypothetical protein